MGVIFNTTSLYIADTVYTKIIIQMYTKIGAFLITLVYPLWSWGKQALKFLPML